MSENERAQMRHDLAAGLLDMNEQLSPLLDAADGMRAEMERRGWSPTAAETVALQWLCSTLGVAFKGAK